MPQGPSSSVFCESEDHLLPRRLRRVQGKGRGLAAVRSPALAEPPAPRLPTGVRKKTWR